MHKTTKWISNKRLFMITGISIAVLIGLGGKVYMNKEAEKKEMQELALKDDKAIAQKIKDNFEGVEEITFYSTGQLPSEIGGYSCNLSVKYSWSNLLSERDREATKHVVYRELGKAERLDDGDIVSDIFGTLYGNDSQIYDDHYGKTSVPIKVIYPNGKEENL